MQPVLVAMLSCLLVLVIGVAIGRATAPPGDAGSRRPALPGGAGSRQPAPAAVDDDFDPSEFGIAAPQQAPEEPPAEIDPATLWQMHVERERTASAQDQPEDRPHMVGRGMMHQSMVPARVTSTTSAWGSAAGMLN